MVAHTTPWIFSGDGCFFSRTDLSIHHAMQFGRSAGKEIGAQPPGRTTELHGDEPDSGSRKAWLVNHSCCCQREIFPAEIRQC